ncbi:MAG: transcription-repair coupling factor, partial [Gammaproteobacteria bacterium]
MSHSRPRMNLLPQPESGAPLAEPLNINPLCPVLPKKPGERKRWGQLYGSSYGLIITAAARRHAGPVVVITEDTLAAQRLEYELHFYAGQDKALPILGFPDWETLPYDIFSPHQDIISQRLATLYRLPHLSCGILVLPVATLLQRLLPRDYFEANSLLLDVGQRLDLHQLRLRLESSGYRYVSQVMEHGEFAVRGGLIDLFPMGSALPYRIDLFDEQIETIRTF